MNATCRYHSCSLATFNSTHDYTNCTGLYWGSTLIGKPFRVTDIAFTTLYPYNIGSKTLAHEVLAYFPTKLYHNITCLEVYQTCLHGNNTTKCFGLNPGNPIWEIFVTMFITSILYFTIFRFTQKYDNILIDIVVIPSCVVFLLYMLIYAMSTYSILNVAYILLGATCIVIPTYVLNCFYIQFIQHRTIDTFETKSPATVEVELHDVSLSSDTEEEEEGKFL